jgi:hypothetical protein
VKRRAARAGHTSTPGGPDAREPEHQDDTPLRPVNDVIDRDAADAVLDDDAAFTDQPLTTDATEVVEDDEGGKAYFPPTDPVVRPTDGGQPEILGGFAPTADPPAPDRSADGRVGDEALVDAVRDALALDASTADLQLNVEVQDAVVHLRGTVMSIEDGENAEAIAAAVPGVAEAVDETEVSG